MNNSTTTLENRMNNFDFWYMMSDSNDVYRRESRNHSDIRIELKNLSDAELIELASKLSDKAIEYFKVEVPTAPEPKDAPSEESTIMSNAWAMLKDGLFSSLSEAIKASMKKSKLVTALKNGVAYFSFTKADGTVRESIGTLRDGNFEYKAKTPKKESKIEVIKYFDLEKKSFRACRVDRLISVAA